MAKKGEVENIITEGMVERDSPVASFSAFIKTPCFMQGAVSSIARKEPLQVSFSFTLASGDFALGLF